MQMRAVNGTFPEKKLNEKEISIVNMFREVASIRTKRTTLNASALTVALYLFDGFVENHSLVTVVTKNSSCVRSTHLTCPKMMCAASGKLGY